MVYPHFHSPIVRVVSDRLLSRSQLASQPPQFSYDHPIFHRSSSLLFVLLIAYRINPTFYLMLLSTWLRATIIGLQRPDRYSHPPNATFYWLSTTRHSTSLSLPIPYAVIVRFESLLRLSDLRNGIQSSCYRGRFTVSPMTLHCKDYNMTLTSHTRSTNTSHHTCLLTGMCVTSDLHAKQPTQPSPHIDAVSGVHSLLADMTCCQERPGSNSRCSIRFGLGSSTSCRPYSTWVKSPRRLGAWNT